MTARSNIIYAATMACALAGCANDGSLSTGLNTGSVNPQTAATQSKSQEALCLTLASQIEALNTEGVPDKVSKAAAKKYKLKSTDLTKADELNKANTEFQGKCSSYPPRVAATAPVEPVTATKEAPAKEAEEDGSRQDQAAGAGAEVRGRRHGAAGDDAGLKRPRGRGRARSNVDLRTCAQLSGACCVVKMRRRLNHFCTDRQQGLHAECACGEKRPGFQLQAEDMVSGNVRRARAFGGAIAGTIAVLLAGCAGNTNTTPMATRVHRL